MSVMRNESEKPTYDHLFCYTCHLTLILATYDHGIAYWGMNTVPRHSTRGLVGVQFWEKDKTKAPRSLWCWTNELD